MGCFTEALAIVIAGAILIFLFPIAVKLFFAVGPIWFFGIVLGVLIAGAVMENR